MLKSQKYSEFVFEEVKAVVAQEGGSQQQYKSLCRRAGGIFRTVGLLQFMAFIEAKGTKYGYYQDLGEQLRRELKKLKLVDDDNRDPFFEILRKAQLPEYMHISRTVLELLQWHKRLSEVMISGQSDDHDEGE
ncbi:type III-B CRISPR module-associated protein Cmr5 [Maridesulfovibrio bastinii]|uniref:type III-B CRISPR module-associated protein Cmr5 n=1 Tax=Maridesulfovibrio bastinii TaxID=47157 RepID=UPI0004201EAA|nr:type III-B CRISPR module-associated protein Cmr5 [Maridesulfovibrio bastinii]